MHMKAMRICQFLLCLNPFILNGQIELLPPVQEPFANPPPLEEAQPDRFIPRATLVPERAEEILDYWFGPLTSIDDFPDDQMDIWFAATPEIDREFRERFGDDVVKAARGELNSWRDTPRGRLALVLLLDQFPRHIYRNRPQAFMTDPMAQGIVLEGIQKGDDKRLLPVERAFFYLPLEHAENGYLQRISVDSYLQLLADVPFTLKPQMQEFLRYAMLHQQQIARFGRFPHRNYILGRNSTPEEVVFLKLWGNGS